MLDLEARKEETELARFTCATEFGAVVSALSLDQFAMC